MTLSADARAMLQGVRAVLLDMDGVLYVGNRALPGAQQLLDYLDSTNRSWLCVTNNSSRTSAMFSEKLQNMDVQVPANKILGSAEATSEWLAQQKDPGTRVLMMGESSLRNALLSKGFDLIDDPFTAEVVVASIYFDVNYAILTDVTLAIRNGAMFVATNPDPTLPTERGQVPGTGSLVALLSAASEQKPTYVGKPYPGMYELAMRRLGTDAATTLMVGDRYETDIIGAIQLGIPAAGVLTGVTTAEQYAAVDLPPSIVIHGLPQLLEALQRADEG